MIQKLKKYYNINEHIDLLKKTLQILIISL
jgi:hypothetical protein